MSLSEGSVSSGKTVPETFVEMTGFVKWFDITKGYGFIIVEGQPDVLVHASVLKRDGINTILENAKVKFNAVKRQKGFQAEKILHIDNSTSIIQEVSKKSANRLCKPLINISPWTLVKVKWFNRLRGFGFLECNAVTDIFVHMEDLRKAGILDLKPSENLYAKFGKEDSAGKYRVVEVSKAYKQD